MKRCLPPNVLWNWTRLYLKLVKMTAGSEHFNFLFTHVSHWGVFLLHYLTISLRVWESRSCLPFSVFALNAPFCRFFSWPRIVSKNHSRTIPILAYVADAAVALSWGSVTCCIFKSIPRDLRDVLALWRLFYEKGKNWRVFHSYFKNKLTSMKENRCSIFARESRRVAALRLCFAMPSSWAFSQDSV